jgi:hypothetical protein
MQQWKPIVIMNPTVTPAVIVVPIIPVVIIPLPCLC